MLPRVLKLAGSVVAPTTLLTALLFYFGRLHAYWYFGYSGVNFTVLDLSTRDYLIRSVDGLFVPMIVAAIVGLAALAGLRRLHSELARRDDPRRNRRVAVAVAAVGSVLFVVSIVGVFRPVAFYDTRGLPGLLLGGGALLLAYAAHLMRVVPPRPAPGRETYRPAWVPVAEWAGVFLLVSLGLFWAVGDYSAAVGSGRALRAEAALRDEPSVILFSAKSLSLRAPGVTEVACANPEAAFRFRYDGLKLMLRSGDQYVFLPADWTPTGGRAIVIPRTDQIRMEFDYTAAIDPDPTC